MHTSRYSMGVDVADVNNDGYPEIISVDMLPADPYILKRSLGDDDYDVFQQKLRQDTTISIQGIICSTTGEMAFSVKQVCIPVFMPTDWSWAPLWMDFDNDGLKDLFISNGIPKRLNDMDYINFISNEEIQEKLGENKLGEKDMNLINRFPQIKIPNKFYKNTGDAFVPGPGR